MSNVSNELTTDFEYILLKKLSSSGEFFGKALPVIKKSYFSKIGTQELFGLFMEYYNKHRNVPTLTELVASVKGVSNAEIRSEIIDSLRKVDKTDIVENTEFMLEETLSWAKDALYLEALRIGSDGLMKRDDAMKLKAQELMNELSKLSIDSDLGLDFDDIDEMIKYYSERMVGIRTQHKMLNYRLGPGFLPGTLAVILAAQGVGKSLMMTDIISGLIKQGKNILLVSLEMADREIMKRVHANALDLPINSLIDLSKTEGELEAIRRGDVGPGRDVLSKDDIIAAYNRLKTSGNCGKFFVKDYPTGSFSPLMLEQLVQSFSVEKNIDIDIVFVDYLGIMKSDLLSPSVGLYTYIKSIGEETRAVAKKLNVPIVSASQLNRCFSPDSVIETSEGLKSAREIKAGDRIMSNSGYNTVQSVFPATRQKAYKITTKSGRQIICSGDHKFPTRFGTMTINVGLQPGIKLSTKQD